MFFNFVGLPSSRQNQSLVNTVGATMTNFGSRMKNIQNSLVGETIHPFGVGNDSRTGSVMRLWEDNSKHQKSTLLIGNTQVLYELGLLA